MLDHRFPGGDQLLQQLEALEATEIDENGSLTLFPKKREAAGVKYRVPIEASYTDADGVVIHVLIHVVSGLLHALEIFKEDASRVIRAPQPNLLNLFCPTD